MNQITLTIEDGVAIGSFANPPHGLMDPRTEVELAALLDRIEGNAGVRVLVLTGGLDGVFIRHYSLPVLEERCRKMAARNLTFSTDRPVPEPSLHVSLRRIEALAQPVLCALNGTAMGGGFELALACDLRIAQDGPFSLGLPEVNVGLLPGAGGTQKLPRLIGEAKALELMLLGRTLSPREALSVGMVSEVVDGPVLPHAMAIARELAGKSPHALAHIKRLVRGVGAPDRAQGLADERTLFCDLMVRPDTIALLAEANAGRRDIRAR